VSRIVKCLFVSLVNCNALLLCGCQWFTPKLYVLAKSPDGMTELRIWKLPHGPDSSLRITARRQGEAARTIYEDHNDRILQLAEVAWMGRGDIVAALVCDSASQPDHIIIGYDLNSKQVTTPEVVVPELQKSLRRRYSITPQIMLRYGDPINWACQDNSAFDRFEDQLDHSRNLRPVRDNTIRRSDVPAAQ
jgi:hypothetical protein